MHLAGNDPFFRFRSDVHAGHHQFAVQYVGFEQHSDFPVDKPGVYALDSRLEFGRETGELHNLCFVQQFPPLQVAVIFGWEFTEKRMIFVEEDACGVRRTHLEPGSIPEDRSEVLFHFLAILDFSGCRNQYVSSFLQDGDCLCVQCIGGVNIALSQFYLCGIYPEVPVIDSIAAFDTNFHIQFLRSSDSA